MKHSLITLCLLIVAVPGFAQTYRYGKITKKEWQLNKCPFDTTASAVILFDIGKVDYQSVNGVNSVDSDCKLKKSYFYMTYERHLRIKVIKNNGLDTSLLSLKLRKYQDFKDNLRLFRGLILRQVKGKILKKKLKFRDLKRVSNNDGSTRIMLKINNLKAGTIVDLDYIVYSKNIYLIHSWDFQDSYPDLYSEVDYTIPNFFLVTKKCGVMQKLTEHKYTHTAYCGVSHPLENHNGWKYYKYIYKEKEEDYSLKNVHSAKKPQQEYIIKYFVKSYDISSVEHS